MIGCDLSAFARFFCRRGKTEYPNMVSATHNFATGQRIASAPHSLCALTESELVALQGIKFIGLHACCQVCAKAASFPIGAPQAWARQ